MKDECECAWCGKKFEASNTRGPKPKFCRRSHRQRAFEQRRIERLIAEARKR